MDLEKMNLKELDELIKMASVAKERKRREKKDAEWEEFSKVWFKIFKEEEEIEIGYESYTLSEILDGLKEAFYY